MKKHLSILVLLTVFLLSLFFVGNAFATETETTTTVSAAQETVSEVLEEPTPTEALTNAPGGMGTDQRNMVCNMRLHGHRRGDPERARGVRLFQNA